VPEEGFGGLNQPTKRGKEFAMGNHAAQVTPEHELIQPFAANR